MAKLWWERQNLSVVAEVTRCTTLWRLRPSAGSLTVACSHRRGDAAGNLQALNCGFQALEEFLTAVSAALGMSIDLNAAAKCGPMQIQHTQRIFGAGKGGDDLNE